MVEYFSKSNDTSPPRNLITPWKFKKKKEAGEANQAPASPELPSSGMDACRCLLRYLCLSTIVSTSSDIPTQFWLETPAVHGQHDLDDGLRGQAFEWDLHHLLPKWASRQGSHDSWNHSHMWFDPILFSLNFLAKSQSNPLVRECFLTSLWPWRYICPAPLRA